MRPRGRGRRPRARHRPAARRPSARLAHRLAAAGRSGEPAPAFDWDAAAEHCRTAWLRGRFLARGSLSLAGGRTHLEFVVEPDEAPVLAARLTEFGLPASWRLRRGRGVVTSKNGEAVGTFLRRIGAGGALLELEARQVSRALRGELNRVLNAESANLQRAVSAAGRQLDAIATLDADGRLRDAAVRRPAGRRRRGARRRRRASRSSPSGSRSIARPSSARSSASSGWRRSTPRPVRRRVRPQPALA